MVSLYRFLEDWFFETGSVSLEEFAEYYLNRPENDGYWGHTSSWWEQSQNPDVLMFTFERMKRDLPGMVSKAGDFPKV